MSLMYTVATMCYHSSVGSLCTQLGWLQRIKLAPIAVHFFKLILCNIKPALDSVQLQKKTSVVMAKF